MNVKNMDKNIILWKLNGPVRQGLLEQNLAVYNEHQSTISLIQQNNPALND